MQMAYEQQQQQQLQQEEQFVVSFYKFAHLPDYATKRKPLAEVCTKVQVSGGIILAAEGINGSLCGSKQAIAEVLAAIRADARLATLRVTAEACRGDHSDAFRWGHVRVKLKKEIVSLGVSAVDPAKGVGRYVKPQEWNQLISDPETIVIDVRNSYETRLGKFKGAVDPVTDSFREFPEWVDKHLVGVDGSNRRIAAYCTGGIRCEKATALLLQQGFDEVYHLEGGILKYLEEVDASQSLWQGECFVFDKRVSVEHGLKTGSYQLCYACKQPVSDDDMKTAQWEQGISCPYCFGSKSQAEKSRARARHSQFQLVGMGGGKAQGDIPAV